MITPHKLFRQTIHTTQPSDTQAFPVFGSIHLCRTELGSVRLDQGTTPTRSTILHQIWLGHFYPRFRPSGTETACTWWASFLYIESKRQIRGDRLRSGVELNLDIQPNKTTHHQKPQDYTPLPITQSLAHTQTQQSDQNPTWHHRRL